MIRKVIAAASLAGLMLVSPAPAATIVVSPATFDFGSVAIGDTVSHQFAVHTEPGGGESFVTVGPLKIGLDPAFSVPPAENTCFGFGDCTVAIYFSPTTPGLVSDQLSLLLIVSTTFGNFPVSFPVALSGIGVAPSEVPLPGALVLFASGLGLAGLLGWRRKHQAAAA